MTIFTTHKRSLGKDNILRSVCQSFYPLGVLCVMSHPVWLPGPMVLLEGSLSLVLCSFQGGLCPGGFCPGGLCQRDPQTENPVC